MFGRFRRLVTRCYLRPDRRRDRRSNRPRQAAAGRLRALRLGFDRRGGGGAAGPAPGGDHPVRRQRSAAARRPAGAARRELRAAERVSGGHLPRAARGGRFLRRRRAGPDRRRGRGGRPDRARRAHLSRARPPGPRQAADLSALRDRERGRGRGADGRARRCRPRLDLQPEQPDRRARRAGGDRRAGAVGPARRGRGRRGLLRVRRRDGRSADRGRSEPRRPPHALEGVRARRPAGRLRGRLAARWPASSTAAGIPPPSPRRLRGSARPRSARRGSRSSRRSPSGSECGARCSPPASTARRPTRTSSSSASRDAAGLADRLEEQGLVVRRFLDAIRITVRQPAENDRILAALGAEGGARRRPLCARRPDDRRDGAADRALASTAWAAHGSRPGSASSTTC